MAFFSPGCPIAECVCVASQEVEYNLLEEQLQKTLTDLGRREKQLSEAELEVRTTRCVYSVLFGVAIATLTLCRPDSKAAEGAEGQIRPGPPGDEGRERSGPEGAAGELQEAAAGERPPGGAGEGQGPADGGGASSAAAAGT